MEACLPGIGQEEEAVFAKESPRLMGVRIKDGTMYPLMQPTLNDLAGQIISNQSTENLTYPSTSRYTSTALLNAINTALDKAKVD